MKLANKLLELRKKKGISQEELAEKIEVTRQTISNWETGETSPNLEQAAKLSQFYQVSLDELVGNDIQNIALAKMSNVEKLAGIMITILKVLGVLFLLYLILMIVGGILFMVVRKSPQESFIQKSELTCTLQEKDYVITIESDGLYKCSNCDADLHDRLESYVNFDDIENSMNNIQTEFISLGGTCK